MENKLDSIDAMVRWLVLMVWLLLCTFGEMKSTVAKLEHVTQEASDDEKQS